ncbi:MAG TPA: glycosyltransferase family 2 protein [Tepidisphaeraceae bacterium]|nr:glycosyltransferase family 2 protein [Tepidisphaeraceae bacterium]
MPHPRLSIAMATYNGARFLQAQLDSLAAQSRKPDELIICDDRSTDDTRATVQRFAADAPFPVQLVVNEENLGIRRNFEKAITLATGEIIFLCDQDDVWHPDKLARFEAAFAQDAQIGLVFADAHVVDEQLHRLGYTFWQRLEFTERQQARFAQDQGFDVLLKHCFVAGATLAFRSSFKPLILPLSGVWMYDAWIAMAISAVAKSRIIPEPLNEYRQHQRQAIGGVKKGIWQRYIEAKHAVNADFFRARAAEYIELRDRLGQASGWSVDEQILTHIDAKIALCQTRSRMRARPLLRLPLLLRTLLAGDYHRYAHGWKTVLLDLFV